MSELGAGGRIVRLSSVVVGGREEKEEFHPGQF